MEPARVRSVAILVVGDEILAGEVADENGPWLLRRLGEAGVRVERLLVAPDRESAVVQELQRLRPVVDAVVVSGGIGPTHDDVTRPAVARALGVDLVVHPAAEDRIRGFYAERVTPAELQMARVPRGARLLHGRRTGSFGFGVAGLYVLPGVPFLFRDIGETVAEEFSSRPLHRTELRTRRREGEIASGLADVQVRCVDVSIGSYPVYEDGAWHVRVVLRAGDPERLRQVAAEIRTHLEP